MDLMDVFKQQMTSAAVNQLAQKVGLSNSSEAQTQQAAQSVFSTLLGVVAKNAATPKGAESLNAALEKDHDGSIMDHVQSFLSPGATQGVSERATNGSGILKHLLGTNQQAVAEQLGQANNMSPQSAMSMMQTVAPLVMGALGKAKQQQGFDASSLLGFLGNQSATQNQGGAMSGILSMLDRDGDGSALDDIGGMLGGMFGK